MTADAPTADAPLTEVAPGVAFADLRHAGRARVIAAAVILGPGGAVLIDPGPASCLPTLRAALRGAGLALADLRALVLTHIHLDHAGAAGTLVQAQPDLPVYVHARGAPHLVDPSRLLASAARLYGDAMDRLWGPVLPVPAANVRVIQGGELLPVADRTLEAAYTPGHASHHVAFLDRASGVAFAGDVAGVRPGAAPFVLPPTPPPDIDLDAWRASIAVVRQWRADALVITHFGAHRDPDAHLDDLEVRLGEMAALARATLEATGGGSGADGGADPARHFADAARAWLDRHLSPAEARLYPSAAPLEQCWLGLRRYWRTRDAADG